MAPENRQVNLKTASAPVQPAMDEVSSGMSPSEEGANLHLQTIVSAPRPQTIQPLCRHPLLQTIAGRVFTAPSTSYNNLRKAHGASQNAERASTTRSSTPADGNRRQNQNTDNSEVGRRLEDVFYALENTPWHVVYPSQGDRRSCTVINSTVHPWPQPLDVPASAQVVIIITSLRHQRAGLEFVVQLREKMPDSPPMIAMFMAGDGARSPHEFLDVQRVFRMFGVRDMLVQRSVGRDLRLDMAMCVRRALDSSGQASTEFHARLVDHDNLKFWPCLHRVFLGFPKFDNSCVAAPVPGARIDNSELLKKIGQGAYSDVFLSKNVETGELEAFKVVPKTKLADIRSVARLWQELTLLAGLKHPNVMALKGVKHACRYMFIILEYSGDQNLFRYLKGLPKPDLANAKSCMKQISTGITYLHQEGVAHRDLKPENIVVMESVDSDGATVLGLKIVDFGCAEKAHKVCTDAIGTVPFIAPEVLLAESYNPAMCDMWSCGVVLLELICGLACVANMLRWASPPPANSETARQIIMFFSDPRSIQCSVEAYCGFVDENLLDLLFGLVELSPSHRMTASEAATCAWFQRAKGDAKGG